MIGVVAPDSDHRVVTEFFELFKTPWEYVRPGCRYDVLLCVGDADIDPNVAKLVLFYAGCALPIDLEEGFDVTCHTGREVLSQENWSLVVLKNYVTFESQQGSILDKRGSRQWLYRRVRDGVTVNRIGYDLFAEAAELLTNGQPEEFAEFPTLELHISLLRKAIVDSGIELVEIPPVPEGYECVACLTHDIDHPAIKNHKWDATAFGFLYRATAGSLMGFLRGRLPFRYLVKNWASAVMLPLVYLGLARDFWEGFEDRYFECDGVHPSTYFVIPFRDRPGEDLNGPAPRKRAARYGAKDIKDVIRRIGARECEVGLHGIDAWRDRAFARKELDEVRQFTQATEIGTRMHWLYYAATSPAVLEDAGASYDSTIGYRDTVGFRTGTTQVYKPIEASRLLELPLHVMDTALFYPAYLGLSQQAALTRVRTLIAAVVTFGGCLTVNWHDRSLSPERNWGSCYRALLEVLKEHEAWFATAEQATAWFRMRRSVVFEADAESPRGVIATVTYASKVKLPGLRIRQHNAHQSSGADSKRAGRYVDTALERLFDKCQSANSLN